MSAIACSPAAPVHASDVAVVSFADYPSNDSSAYDASAYPTEPEIRHHLKAVAPAGSTPQDDLTSQSFSTDSGGDASLLPIIFPVAGTWTLQLIDESDGSVTASQSLVVS